MPAYSWEAVLERAQKELSRAIHVNDSERIAAIRQSIEIAEAELKAGNSAVWPSTQN